MGKRKKREKKTLYAVICHGLEESEIIGLFDNPFEAEACAREARQKTDCGESWPYIYGPEIISGNGKKEDLWHDRRLIKSYV